MGPVAPWLRRFAHEVWADWLALMSGVASVTLAALAASWQTALPPWTFWLAGYLCLLFTAFRVWRKADLALQAEVASRLVLEKQLRGQLDDKRQKQTERAQLGELMDRAHKLVTELRQIDDMTRLPEFRRRSEEWVDQALRVVRMRFPEFEAYFLSDGGLSLQGYQVGDVERANLANFLDRRLARLGELLIKLYGRIAD